LFQRVFPLHWSARDWREDRGTISGLRRLHPEWAMERATFWRNVSMRIKLLMMSTAALLAGTLAAASQSIQSGGGAQEKGANSGQGQMSQGQPNKEQSNKELPGKPNRKAQSGQGTRDQAQVKEPSTTSNKEPPTTIGQAPVGRDEDRVQGDQDKKPQGRPQRDQDRKQSQRDQDRQRPGQTEGQAPAAQAPRDQDRQQQGQTQRDQDRSQQREPDGQRSSVSVSFTTEQRTKIRETVFKGRNAPRVSNVNFSLNLGTAVPRTVRIIEVPEVIVDVHPEWRGYRYFIVNEELVIVEPDTLRIVAVVDV
jgi:Protein of unknown function (DUF1236)